MNTVSYKDPEKIVKQNVLHVIIDLDARVIGYGPYQIELSEGAYNQVKSFLDTKLPLCENYEGHNIDSWQGQ